MKTAVVTGANGFIGKAVAKELILNGFFVYCVVTDDRGMSDLDQKKIKIVKAFFEDYPNLTKKIAVPIDLFFHFAWQGVWGSAFKDYKLQMNNAIHCGEAIELAEKLNCRKFVLASTVNVLELKDKINFQGKQPLRYTTNYSMAKLAAEMICRTSAENNGIDFNCAYIAMAYGPGNRSLMVPNVVMGKLTKGIEPDLVKGDGLYDLIYIDDIARGFVAIGLRGHTFKSYYLGHPTLKRFKDIFTEIGLFINPSVRLNFGAYPDDNQIDYSKVDLSELYSDTGFEPSSDFKKSIMETAKWVDDENLVGGVK